MKEKIINHRHHIVFTIFMLMHTLTCLFTNYFGDDYYYAAFLKNGHDYLISENIYHYMHTNGRAIVHLIDELLLGISFWFWRIAAVLVMAALVVILSKLISGAGHRDTSSDLYKNAMIAVCALLSVTDIAVLRQSFYWATGALNYLFPATLTMCLIFLLQRDFIAPFEKLHLHILLVILSFFAAATTEQASAAAIVAIVWIIVCEFVQNRKIRIRWIACFASAICGFLTLMLAPGNAERTQYYPDFYAMPLIRRIITNIPKLAGEIFGPYGLYPLILALFIILAYRSWSKCRPLSIITIITIIGYLIGLRFWNDLLRQWPYQLIFIALLAVIFVASLVDFFKQRDFETAFYLFNAAAMQGAMLLSPEFGPRTLTISIPLLIVPIAKFIIRENSVKLNAILGLCLLASVPSIVSNPYLLLVLFCIFCCSLFVLFDSTKVCLKALPVVLALAIFAMTPAGYAQNLPALSASRDNIRLYDPTLGEPLVLYYLPNYHYKYTMPYDDPYHQMVLLRLCDLPTETPVVYEYFQ
ncbi:MAG: hypothetical protein E7632_04730 [Ruminococcaceae bacterium]|nr:hypothetical protein [Oscillospiraceae bacterium]